MNKGLRRAAIPAAVAAAIGTAGFAFMASNTVPATAAGQGSSTISGYNVSNVHYTLKDQGTQGTAMYVQAVTFSLDHAASLDNTYALISNGSNTPARYGNCAVVGGSTNAPRLTCGHTGNMIQLTAAAKLTVIAAE